MYEQGIKPEIIANGAKIMSLSVKECKVKFIDSLNFLPTALAKLPAMFEMRELCKGYFPHLYNRKENQSKVLDRLPEASYYNPDGMKPEERRKFYTWYEANKNAPFDFQEALQNYCRSDVDILRRCCIRFRELFMDVTRKGETLGIDPFEECVTIASACNLVFRKMFLEPETIGIIPAHGYRPEEKQSAKAIRWIKYLAHTEKRHIQHALNGGEKKIGPYRVDGYYETRLSQVLFQGYDEPRVGNDYGRLTSEDTKETEIFGRSGIHL
ncbi:hypothetical protein BOV88_13610 [Solemya velum gill symbiont]|uniref:DNA-directed DNA polymerase n=1 Tax=Solemya velum gill symbiont TaxID=2340 RepID=A0A1T2CG32_SOVGS|nr:hypothetical protein BOV88_13610 [Solemya velum gill symbiont]